MIGAGKLLTLLDSTADVGEGAWVGSGSNEGDSVSLELDVEGQRLVAIALSERDVDAEWGLTDSETDVVSRVLRGHTNEAIAKARGTSPRTVANQLAAIFRKIGVQGRSELAARLGGSR